jgi:glycolate oxidase
MAEGIIPAAIEMMDRDIVRAVEAYIPAGYPLDAEAVLIVELDGHPTSVAIDTDRTRGICAACGAREVRVAHEPAERERLWAGHNGAFGAVACLRPRYHLQDGVVPRSRLVQTLQEVQAIGHRRRLRIVNVLHAGDGNLQSMILFDPRDAEEMARAHAAGDEIIRACVAAEGTITGEHGIGIEKRHLLSLVSSDADLAAMARLRRAFDPPGRLNPGKLFPSTSGCDNAPALAP